MNFILLWTVAACVFATTTSAERGGSLRGALEALQRRQRGRMHPPLDYESLYEVLPQAYAEPEYEMELEEAEDEPMPKYIVKLLGGNESPPEAYEYKIIKKNSAFNNVSPNKKQSAFRERSQHSDNDKLRDLFLDSNEVEEKEYVAPEKQENDAEYALLLSQLWAKYKANKGHNNMENAPQGVVKLYKEKMVKKSYPDNWGPIAFKRKRSSDLELEKPETVEYEVGKNRAEEVGPINLNYNTYDTSDNDKDDMREEYAIAFQPLDDDTLSDLADEDQYAYDTLEKRFPVTKRSSEPYIYGTPKKRFVLEQNNEKSRTFRNSAGTDPRIIKDLSKIFGDPELTIIKTPVKKRSSGSESDFPDILPPKLTAMHHNHTDDHTNHSLVDDHSHEHQGHNIHPPGVSGKEVIIEHDDHNHDHKHKDEQEHHNHDHKNDDDHNNHRAEYKDIDKPIVLKKKSIDWSDYFGIDKRRKKSVAFVNNLNEDRLKKQYFDTFNKEIIYPLNSFRQHSYVKRNYVQNVPPNESEMLNYDKSLTIRDEKRSKESDSDTKLDNIDKKLKNMEGLIVDEALHYTNIGEDLDSKEEQEMKEKLLSRLAAAYSLEKMRKALKEFKQSLQVQKTLPTRSSPELSDAKDKKVAVKKEKALLGNAMPNFSKNAERAEDFEDEQGAGHYLNGKTEERLSEGYMGGSGRHRFPVISTATSSGSCPVLAKIIQRCRGVDLLAGDRGQLFLPLCSLHQICYLCGEAPPTTCDLVFLSEADSTCEGDMSCQRAARSTLMALRELHDNLADELDGECEASPCLAATLKLNTGWQRALQR